MWFALGVLTGIFLVEDYRIRRKIMTLKDDLQIQITRLSTDLDGLVATVTEVVAEIADLKLQVGSAVTQEQVDAATAIGDKLEKATADLKAGE